MKSKLGFVCASKVTSATTDIARATRGWALLAALLRFDLLPAGFRNRELREAVAPLRGMSLDDYNAGQMTYDLRRLRLRGLIERIPHSAVSAHRRRAVHRPGLPPHPGARPGPGLVGHARWRVDHPSAGSRRRVRSRGRPPLGRTRAGRVTSRTELPEDREDRPIPNSGQRKMKSKLVKVTHH